MTVSPVTLPLKLYKYLGFLSQTYLLISILSSSAMEFHFLPLLFSLNVSFNPNFVFHLVALFQRKLRKFCSLYVSKTGLQVILMTAQAALPPELYWERMLPNTPIPNAIRDIPKLGQLLRRLRTQNLMLRILLHTTFFFLNETYQLLVFGQRKYETHKLSHQF